MDHRVVSLYTYFLSRKHTCACTCIQCVCVLAFLLMYEYGFIRPYISVLACGVCTAHEKMQVMKDCESEEV